MRAHGYQTLDEIAAADYRAAAVFERLGLDFWDEGSRTLRDACQVRGVDVEALLHELQQLPEDKSCCLDQLANAWPLDTLIEHIVSRHHAYVKTLVPILTAHTTRIAAAHGERNPELAEVARILGEIACTSRVHMMQEEQTLFPHIRSLAGTDRASHVKAPTVFGTVHDRILKMEAEHEQAGERWRLIRETTRGYAVPDHAGTAYRVCFKELEEFERDLHRHVHLENNILFPRAIRLEERLLRSRASRSSE